MSRINRRIGLALIVLSISMATACGRHDALRVGVVLPLSGPGAGYGASVQNGLELAFEELRNGDEEGQPPYGLELVFRDSQGDPDQAAALTRELFADGVTAVIGGVTDQEALAMAPVASSTHRVVLSPTASSPALAGVSRYLFRLYPAGDREGVRMASFVAGDLRLDRVVVVHPEDAPEGAEDAFGSEIDRRGGEVVAEVAYAQEAGAATVASETLEHTPQAVYVLGPAESVSELVAELRRQRFRGAVLTTSAFSVPEVLQEAGRSAEGVYVSRTVFDAGSEDPRVEELASAHRERHGVDPDLFAAYGYDALKVLVAAVQESGLSPSQLWTGMRAIREHQGATGPIQFDEGGGVPSFPRVYVVRDGRLTAVATPGERVAALPNRARGR